jgi:hypothetical protein
MKERLFVVALLVWPLAITGIMLLLFFWATGQLGGAQ